MYGFIIALLVGIVALVVNSILRSLGWGVIGDALAILGYIASMFGLKLGGHL